MKFIHQRKRALAFVMLLGVICGGTHSPRSSANSLSRRAQTSPGEVRSVSNSGPQDKTVRARISQSYGNLPIRFEANRAGGDAGVRFMARGGGYSLFLTKDGAALRLRKGELGSDRQGD